MSTTAEVGVQAPTSVASDFRCSRCGSAIESEGEHLEYVSRTILHAYREGDQSVLLGEQKLFPANRYCIGCSGPVFNALNRRTLSNELIVVLMPDTTIGQHLHKIIPAIKLRYHGEAGMTVISLRWISPTSIYLLMADPDAGEYREYNYNLENNRCEPARNGVKVLPVKSLLIANAPDTVKTALSTYLPHQDLPKFEPVKIELKAPKLPAKKKARLTMDNELTWDEATLAPPLVAPIVPVAPMFVSTPVGPPPVPTANLQNVSAIVQNPTPFRITEGITPVASPVLAAGAAGVTQGENTVIGYASRVDPIEQAGYWPASRALTPALTPPPLPPQPPERAR